MNMILDAGAHVPGDSFARRFVRPFGAVDAALVADNLNRIDAARADSGASLRGAAWTEHLRQAASAGGSLDKGRFDALGRDFARALTADRADSGAGLPALSGKVEIGAPLLQLIQDRADILEGIPARPVDGNASGWYRNYIKPGGTATLIRGDDTTINRVSYVMSQDLRPLQWCGVALSAGWLEQRRTSQAGVDDARWKMEGVTRAIRDFWWGAILDGRTTPGLDFYSLATVPGLLRYYSGVTLGTTTIATVLTELVKVMTKAQELSPADLAPDRVIITDRLRNRLMATTAAPYSALDAWDYFTAKANALGLQVVIGKSLRDFGGSGIDGMLFFRSEANSGLRIVKGLDVTPVHTYVDASGQVTIYASSGGGLEMPYAEGCLLAYFPWS